jgi:hypothetical protein
MARCGVARTNREFDPQLGFCCATNGGVGTCGDRAEGQAEGQVESDGCKFFRTAARNHPPLPYCSRLIVSINAGV